MANIKAAKQDERPQRGGWAPGSYLCTCIPCGAIFIGDKRARVCADCAYKFNPAFDMPSTAAEAVAVLTAWGDPGTMTFSAERAAHCAALLLAAYPELVNS